MPSLSHRFLLALSCLALATTACGDDGAKTTDADGSVADAAAIDADLSGPVRFTDCRYDFPGLSLVEGADFECGDLTVPEDYSDTDSGRDITLHFIRLRSTVVPDAKLATIYLAGGPGSNGASFMYRLDGDFADFREGFLEIGDFLIISQRGTARSEPFLNCVSPEDCAAQGLTVDINAYNTAYNADDVDALRAALGYDALNLYGISYGSRLGLEVLRRHGDKVRAAVLGGLVPSDINWPAESGASFSSAARALDASCQADEGCFAAYGDLIAKLSASYTELNSNPLPVILDDGSEIFVDGYTYIVVLQRSLYSRDLHGILPKVIHEVSQRNGATLGELVTNYFAGFSAKPGIATSPLSNGLYSSVVCGEVFNPGQPDAFERAAERMLSVVVEYYQYAYDSTRDNCASWPKDPQWSALASPVSSSVPTLIANGALDPITPPSFGDVAMVTLDNAVEITYADSGHGATLQSECGNGHVLDFLRDPETPLDTACAAAVRTDYALPSAFAPFAWPSAAKVRRDLELVGLSGSQVAKRQR